MPSISKSIRQKGDMEFLPWGISYILTGEGGQKYCDNEIKSGNHILTILLQIHL